MKFLSAFLTLSFLSILVFPSCKKCKDCETKITTVVKEAGKNDSTAATTRNEGELCGDDLKALDGKTFNSKSTSSGVTYETTRVTTCK